MQNEYEIKKEMCEIGSSFPDTKPLSAPTRTDTTTAAISMCISLSILCG